MKSDADIKKGKDIILASTQTGMEKGHAVVGVYSDIASGLNANRRGLLKLFTAVKKGKVDVIVVEFQDRLARFGY